MTTIERFIEKTIPEPMSGCLLWTAAKQKSGYGIFKVGGKCELAHRVSFRLFVGDPGENCVLHKCDTPACVEPRHFFLGDRDANNKDRTAKGRGNSGIRNKEKILCKRGHKNWKILHPKGRNPRRKCLTCEAIMRVARK